MPLFYKKLSKSQGERKKKIKNYQKTVDKRIKNCKMMSTNNKNMNTFTTHLSESELVAVGRAMELLGYDSVEKFIADAVNEKAAVVATGKEGC